MAASGIDIRLTPSRSRSLGQEIDAVAGHEDEEEVALAPAYDEGLDDVDRLDTARLGRLGEAAHRPVPDDPVRQPGRLDGGQRPLLAGHGRAPTLPTARAASRLPAASAVSGSGCSSQEARKPAANASPAPVVSTTSTPRSAGALALMKPCCHSAPSAPSLTTTSR